MCNYSLEMSPIGSFDIWDIFNEVRSYYIGRAVRADGSPKNYFSSNRSKKKIEYKEKQ